MPLFLNRSTAWIWLAVIAGVLAVLLIFQFMRANRPAPEANRSQAAVYTTGTIVEGELNIPTDQYLSYRMNFNKKSKLIGNHWTGDTKRRVLVLVLSDQDFEKWKAGGEFKAVIQTGYVPRSKVESVIDPGVYHLVFDNRSKEYGGDQKIDANFTAN